ncbi:response regulator receiver protein [Halorubrum sp. Atlit-8R]|uniref:response regulator receiver protein n=1 Tax=unclassified Halorubrum TaxID=2642239 RepID=UPI000EF26DD6|nr:MULTISPECIES: response regulator receiver protein [unclassified Halorubrum]RLM72226.1 response regulator receiver protein [Halorubrum sp. Atlit-9R]RLM83332.1 response regulator receiver protein [Halorubrum sp. Atlit-8R]
MELPVSTVVVCETNRTRADLYGLWLDGYDARLALTNAQFDEAFDVGVAVLVLDDSFGGGDPGPVLDRVESAAPHCRVLGVRDRDEPEPEPRRYHQAIERPVFEGDLVERVETLSHRANYHLLLDKYYRTTVLLSVYEWRADGDPTDEERYERLLDRAQRLREYLKGIRPRMRDEDVRAVAESIAVPEVGDGDTEARVETKYRPDECARCGRDWTASGGDGDAAEKLGAYVWRCGDCGHVDMRADPSHRRVSSFKG